MRVVPIMIKSIIGNLLPVIPTGTEGKVCCQVSVV